MSGPERWGWQCADLSRAVLPFPEPPPTFTAPPPPDLAALNAAALQAFAAQQKTRHTITMVMWLALLPFVLGVASVLLLVIYDVLRFPLATQTPVGYAIMAALAAGWLVYWSRRRAAFSGSDLAQRYMDKGLAEYHAAVEIDRRRYDEQLVAWQARKAQFDQLQSRQLAALPRWGAARLTSDPTRVEIFGDPGSWAALVVTLATSLLAAGEQVEVLDLSDHGLYHPLRTVVGRCPWLLQREVRLPEDAARHDLLADLSEADIRDVLIEATHSDLDGPSRDQRALADRVLSEVVEHLRPTLTMSRIWRALRTVTGQEPVPAPGSELTITEWNNLATMFGEDYRVRVGELLMRLENQLYALRASGSSAEPAAAADLTCVSIEDSATSVTTDLLVSLVVVRFIRRLRTRQHGQRPQTLIVLGADVVPEKLLQRLAAAAENDRARIVTLFRTFEERHLDRAASGGAVGFFRLPNEAQARRAADVIGREHRFVLSQLTTARGTTNGWSTAEGFSTSSTASWANMDGAARPGFVPFEGGESLSIGESSSRTRTVSGGTSAQETSGVQRVEEHVVNPTTLRTLANGALLLVEFADQTGRRLVAADVDPRVAEQDSVSTAELPPSVMPVYR